MLNQNEFHMIKCFRKFQIDAQELRSILFEQYFTTFLTWINSTPCNCHILSRNIINLKFSWRMLKAPPLNSRYKHTYTHTLCAKQPKKGREIAFYKDRKCKVFFLLSHYFNNFIEALKYKRHSSLSIYSCLFIWDN